MVKNIFRHMHPVGERCRGGYITKCTRTPCTKSKRKYVKKTTSTKNMRLNLPRYESAEHKVPGKFKMRAMRAKKAGSIVASTRTLRSGRGSM